VVLCAPPIESQLFPFLLHRIHVYMNFVGLFVHVPALPVRVWPSCAVPVIVGLTVFTGGDFAAAAGAA
jgi:hypothetical protein